MMFYKTKHLTLCLMVSILGVFIFMSFLTVESENEKADAIIGIWKTSSLDYSIELFKVNKEYQGKIVGIKKGLFAGNDPVLDKLNPQRSLRGKPVVGMTNVTGFEYNPYDGVWEEGIFYNPTTGETMKCTISMNDSNALEMTGFLGFALTEVKMNWKRVKP